MAMCALADMNCPTDNGEEGREFQLNKAFCFTGGTTRMGRLLPIPLTRRCPVEGTSGRANVACSREAGKLLLARRDVPERRLLEVISCPARAAINTRNCSMIRSAREFLFLPALIALAGSAVAATPSMAGTPDIEGVWNRYPPYADTFSNQPDPPELDLVEPPLKEPYLTEWRKMRAKRAAAEAAGRPLPTPSSLCQPEGVPGIMGAHYSLQILQNPGQNQVVVLGEFMSQIRRIYLNEEMPHSDTINPGYFGYSVAKWVGDVLEVNTAGIREDVVFEDIPHSIDMRVSERIYLNKENILVDDIIIEDHKFLSKPYKFTFMYKREPSTYKVGEYVCDNQSVIVEEDGTLGVKLEE